MEVNDQDTRRVSPDGERLMQAIEYGERQKVEELLAAGVDPNYMAQQSTGIDNFFNTYQTEVRPEVYPLLMAAVLRPDSGIVKLLVEAGADVNYVVQGDYGIAYDALSVACLASSKFETIKILLENGANTLFSSVANDDRFTAILKVSDNHPEIVECMLQYPQTAKALESILGGASGFHKDRPDNEETAVRIAQRAVAAGANVNAELNGWTPLGNAAIAKMPRLIDFLVQAGADVHYRLAGKSHLFWTVTSRCAEGVALLSKVGVKADGGDFFAAIQAVDDAVLVEVMKNLHAQGIDPRGFGVASIVKYKTLLEWLLKNDMVNSARFMFEELKEDPFQRRENGKPLTSICGTAAKEVLLSARTMSSIACGDGEVPAQEKKPKNELGML